jgi:hypothetical protein
LTNNEIRKLDMAKHKLRKKDPNARQRLAAVKHAEAQLERPMTGQSNAMLRPETIATRTELFQPRGFFHGMYELDNDHVKKLAREIRIKGELDPFLSLNLAETGCASTDTTGLRLTEKTNGREQLSVGGLLVTCGKRSTRVSDAIPS